MKKEKTKNNEQSTWFTSDLHFGHKNIMRFCPKYRSHYQDVEAMDEMLIDMWNTSVKPNDIIYDLGDLFFYRDLNKIKSILKRLNGKHHLILGNHDVHLLTMKQELLDEGLLESISSYKEIQLHDGTKAVLFHYPIFEWNQGHRGAVMLHGHIHDRNLNHKINGKILNVGFDNFGYMLDENMIFDLTKNMSKITFD